MKRFFLLIVFLFAACSSSDIEDILDVIEGVDRKAINRALMGINAFGNKPEFGSACEQYQDISNNLGIKFLRILIHWNNAIQPNPAASPDFSFYDSLLNCVPEGVDALLVVTGLPGWMNDSANWVDGNPRTTFVDQWFRKVFNRYNGRANVIGFQVWNEPNMLENSENTLLQVQDSPANYIELLARAYSHAKDKNSSKLILNAATTSIAQNYKSTFNYNKDLKDQGVESFIDVFAIHYYGEQFERLINPDDSIADFLSSIGKSIWITESGKQGSDQQLAYVETVWPFLREKVPNIGRIYYYQYASNGSAESTFGLRNSSADSPFSDLFVFLNEN